MSFPGLPSDLVLRMVGESDEEFLAELYRSTRQDLLLMNADRSVVAQIVAMQRRAQAAGYRETFPAAQYFVLEHLSQKTGRLVVDFGADRIHLVDMALMPEAQGKGHGTIMLEVLQRKAHGQNIPVSLSVSHSNDLARRLYLSLGFRIERSTELFAQLIWYPS
jgi:ribosomal protein S18 acetylase RimI-like enzyme